MAIQGGIQEGQILIQIEAHFGKISGIVKTLTREINLLDASLRKSIMSARGLSGALSAIGQSRTGIGKRGMTGLAVTGAETSTKQVQGLTKAYKDLGQQGLIPVNARLKTQAGVFGKLSHSMGRTLAIALRWYVAYRLIRGVIGGVNQGLEDMVDVQSQMARLSFYMPQEHLNKALQDSIVLGRQYGMEFTEVMRTIGAFYRVYRDYEKSIYATNNALKMYIATGTDVRESIDMTIGILGQMNLGLKDQERLMEMLIGASLRMGDEFYDMGKGSTSAVKQISDALDADAAAFNELNTSMGQTVATNAILVKYLDDTGQRIGSLTARMLAGLKPGGQMIQLFEDMGIQIPTTGKALETLFEAYGRADAGGKKLITTTMGQSFAYNIANVVFQKRAEILELSNNLQEKSNLLNEMSAKMMKTVEIEGKRTAAAWRAFWVDLRGVGIPALTLWYKTLRLIAFELRHLATLGPQIQKIEEATWHAITLRFGLAKESFQEFVAMQKRLIGSGKEGLAQIEAEIRLEQKVAEAKLQKLKADEKVMEAMNATNLALRLIDTRYDVLGHTMGMFASDQEKATYQLVQAEQQMRMLAQSAAEMIGEGQIRKAWQWAEQLAGVIANFEKIVYTQKFYAENQAQALKYRLMEVSETEKYLIVEEKIKDMKQRMLYLDREGLLYGELQLKQLELEREKSVSIARAKQKYINVLKEIGKVTKAVPSLYDIIFGTAEEKEGREKAQNFLRKYEDTLTKLGKFPGIQKSLAEALKAGALEAYPETWKTIGWQFDALEKYYEDRIKKLREKLSGYEATPTYQLTTDQKRAYTELKRILGEYENKLEDVRASQEHITKEDIKDYNRLIEVIGDLQKKAKKEKITPIEEAMLERLEGGISNISSRVEQLIDQEKKGITKLLGPEEILKQLREDNLGIIGKIVSEHEKNAKTISEQLLPATRDWKLELEGAWGTLAAILKDLKGVENKELFNMLGGDLSRKLSFSLDSAFGQGPWDMEKPQLNVRINLTDGERLVDTIETVGEKTVSVSILSKENKNRLDTIDTGLSRAGEE